MGRPELEGVVRYHSGRINQRETQKLLEQVAKSDGKDKGPPSPKILRERQLFNATCFKGGKQAQHAGDAIGQLWLVGKLDIKGYDETKLLQAARDWWRGREETYKNLQHKTASYERVSRTSGSSTKMNKLEKAYERYERFLLDASDYDRDCLADLMEVRNGEHCWWATRIVQTAVLGHFVMELTVLSCASDDDKLEAAKRALVAMAGVEAMVPSEERDAA